MKASTVITLILSGILIIGCSTVKYVPVVHTEYVVKERVDSVDRIVHDSVYVKEHIYEKGDTVFYETIKWKIRTEYKESLHLQIDTLIVRDTVAVQVPAQLTPSQAFYIRTGKYTLGLCVLLAIAALVYIGLKLKRKIYG